MHRSGTSAVAAALRTLGFDAGPDGGLMAADLANPHGYFEVREIADLDDEILAILGGRWDAPPILPAGWENDPALTPWVRRAMTTRASRLPGDRWLLKDPRVSLLLPLWRRAVLDRCAAVLVVRDPMEVAWSVALRNGLPTMTGLALWSAYNRAAVAGLDGLPVFVCVYDRLVADPTGTLGELATALGDWGEVEPGDVARAAQDIRPELRRRTWRRDAPDAWELPVEVERLAAVLDGLAGRHDVFVPPTLPEGSWEQALLSERRFGIEETRRARDGERDALEARDALGAELAAREAERDRAVAERQAEVERLRVALEATRSELAAERNRHGETRRELRRAEARWQRLLDRPPVRFARSVRRVFRPRPPRSR